MSARQLMGDFLVKKHTRGPIHRHSAYAALCCFFLGMLKGRADSVVSDRHTGRQRKARNTPRSAACPWAQEECR